MAYKVCQDKIFIIIIISITVIIVLDQKMPLNEHENQWQKLFQHLNYCISVLKKTMDQQKLEIFKRVQNDVQILQKYIKSIMKYNLKGEKEIQRLVQDLKRKDHQLQSQNSQIIQLGSKIQQREADICKKQTIIQHLKYAKKIDASYVSSILVNGSSSILQREMNRLDRKRATAEQAGILDGLCLSQYSQQFQEETPEKVFFQTQTTEASTNSEIKAKTPKFRPTQFGVINEEEQISDQSNSTLFSSSQQTHKASSLIFVD